MMLDFLIPVGMMLMGFAMIVGDRVRFEVRGFVAARFTAGVGDSLRAAVPLQSVDDAPDELLRPLFQLHTISERRSKSDG